MSLIDPERIRPMAWGPLERIIRESRFCSLVGEDDGDPCFRVGAHYCYPRREKNGRVAAGSSPQYCKGTRADSGWELEYPVERIIAMAMGYDWQAGWREESR